jgi:hypothetical protein
MKKKIVKKSTRKQPEFPRGYKVNVVNRTLNIGGKPDLYEVYEVEHKTLERPKMFVDKESVQKFITATEANKVEAKALSLKGYQHVKGVVSQHKEAMVAPELEEIAKALGY